MAETLTYAHSFSAEMLRHFNDTSVAFRVADAWLDKQPAQQTSYAELLRRGQTDQFAYPSWLKLAFLRETTFSLTSIPRAIEQIAEPESIKSTAAQAFLTSYALSSVVHGIEMSHLPTDPPLDQALAQHIIPQAVENYLNLLRDPSLRPHLEPGKSFALDLYVRIAMEMSRAATRQMQSGSGDWLALTPIQFTTNRSQPEQTVRKLPERRIAIRKGELAEIADFTDVVRVLEYMKSVPNLPATDLIYFFEYGMGAEFSAIARKYPELLGNGSIKDTVLKRVRRLISQDLRFCTDQRVRMRLAEYFGLELIDTTTPGERLLVNEELDENGLREELVNFAFSLQDSIEVGV